MRLYVTAFLIGVIVCIGWFGLQDYRNLRALQHHGKTTLAIVTDKESSFSKTTHYMLHYRFQTGSATVNGSDPVSPQEYNETQIGASLLVTYLPRNPIVHCVGVVTNARIGAACISWAVGGLFAIVALGVIIGAWLMSMKMLRSRIARGYS